MCDMPRACLRHRVSKLWAYVYLQPVLNQPHQMSHLSDQN